MLLKFLQHPKRLPVRIAAPYRQQAGFTVLELTIASAIFAVILLVMAVGVIRITDDYYKGITSSTTQSTARSIMADIVEAIQFSKSVLYIAPNPGSGNVGGYCVDNTLYAFKIGQEVVSSPSSSSPNQGYHGLVKTTGVPCTSGWKPTLPSTPDLSPGSRELLGQNMRLALLSVTPIMTSKNLYSVRVRIIHGDDDLLFPTIGNNPTWSSETCAGSTGSQFCAVTDLTTTVEQRLL